MIRRSVCAIAAMLVLVPAAQAARRAPCVEGGKGPKCTFWDARVLFIADGDTIRVRVGGAVRNIRFTGLNAMELTRYSKYPSRRRGACHGLEATALVERYIRGSRWKVRLAAQKASSRTGKRLRRSVWVKVRGRWRDLSRIELQRGLALWLPNSDEDAHNREYGVLAQRALRAQKGLYDPDACGAGPDQDIPLSVSVNWDADGDDEANLEGEWVDVHNGGSRAIDVGGWWIRDSWLRYGAGHVPGFRIPAGTSIGAGQTLRLRVGCSGSGLHWCQKASAFENHGDGAYLFDPQGDLRASGVYPCYVACSDPLAGQVRLSVHPSRPESMTIANASGAPVDLGGHILKLHLGGRPDQFIFGYPFTFGTVVPPGGELTVDPGGSSDADTALVKHAGRGEFVLADGQGTVSLRTFDDLVTACETWGGGRC
jgi:endonuclease YncB( thermonuclease family)